VSTECVKQALWPQILLLGHSVYKQFIMWLAKCGAFLLHCSPTIFHLSDLQNDGHYLFMTRLYELVRLSGLLWFWCLVRPILKSLNITELKLFLVYGFTPRDFSSQVTCLKWIAYCVINTLLKTRFFLHIKTLKKKIINLQHYLKMKWLIVSCLFW